MELAFDDFSGGLWLPGELHPVADQAAFATPPNALLQADNVEILPTGGLRGRRGRQPYSQLPGPALGLFRHYPRAGLALVGPNGPALVSNEASIGTEDWISPTAVAQYGGAFAHVPLGSGDISHYLLCQSVAAFPRIPVPLGAVITGVQVFVSRRSLPNAGIKDASIRLSVGGVISGANKADPTHQWGTEFETAIYGGAADLWGVTLTPAIVNDGTFGVAIAAQATSTAQSAEIDAVTVTIYYRADLAPVFLQASAVAGITRYTEGTVPTLIGNQPLQGGRVTFVSWPEKNLTFFFDGVNELSATDGTQIFPVIGSGLVPPPKGPYATFWKQRLVASAPEELDFSIYASRIGDHTNYDSNLPTGGAIQISLNDPDGGTLTGIESFAAGNTDVLIALKTTSLWNFVGDLEFGGNLNRYSDIGCIAPASVQKTPFGILYVGLRGVYLTDGASPNSLELSRALSVLWQDREVQRIYPRAVGLYVPRRQQYWLKLDPELDEGYILQRWLNLKQEEQFGWCRVPVLPMAEGCVWGGEGDQGEPFVASTTGVVRQCDIGALDDAAAIACAVQTAFQRFNSSSQIGMVYAVKPTYRGAAALTGGVRYDEVRLDQVLFSLVAAPLGMHQPRLTITDMSQSGKDVSLRLANATDGPEFELHEILCDARMRSAKLWR